ncbi:MAG TPA: methyltransferase domain-containing protein [Bacteroidia bacterium]|jgi:SAM-dependent methyltransferase|nr:methyltransferase domain-containing protein [Bacteroidia bacterium]
MIFEYLKLNLNIDDNDFNAIYPEWVRTHAQRHWTPLEISKKVAEFLVDKPGTKVLDIGSGPGKFCMAGATFTKGHFTGVEQRYSLVKLSKKLAQSYRIKNIDFIHANITSIKFKDYESFYFYNSFHENIDFTAKIDNTIEPSVELYNLYHKYVREQLSLAPIGTRLATYWSAMKEIPSSYKIKCSFLDGILLFWEKTR